MPQVLIETKGEALLNAMQAGTVSTNVFLRRLHNFCVELKNLLFMRPHLLDAARVIGN